MHLADVDSDSDSDVLVTAVGIDSVRWFENGGENMFGVYEWTERDSRSDVAAII